MCITCSVLPRVFLRPHEKFFRAGLYAPIYLISRVSYGRAVVFTRSDLPTYNMVRSRLNILLSSQHRYVCAKRALATWLFLLFYCTSFSQIVPLQWGWLSNVIRLTLSFLILRMYIIHPSYFEVVISSVHKR